MNELLLAACQWAKDQETSILASGTPLSDRDLAVARAVGVAVPERVRCKVVTAIPAPDDRELFAAATALGLLGDRVLAITFGYGVYFKSDNPSVRLLSHELRHVHQYEVAGSIDTFLQRYLHELLSVGYRSAPLEVDARKHEINAYPV